MVKRHYQPIVPNERGWLWCEELGVWVGTWEGTYQAHPATWPRFFDAQFQLLPTEAEAERQRANTFQAELARLQARLTDKGITPAE